MPVVKRGKKFVAALAALFFFSFGSSAFGDTACKEPDDERIKGLGIVLGEKAASGTLRVVAVLAGSPASFYLHSGDLILEVDGVDLEFFKDPGSILLKKISEKGSGDRIRLKVKNESGEVLVNAHVGMVCKADLEKLGELVGFTSPTNH